MSTICICGTRFRQGKGHKKHQLPQPGIRRDWPNTTPVAALLRRNATKVAGTDLDGTFADGVAGLTESVVGQQRLIQGGLGRFCARFHGSGWIPRQDASRYAR
jgi:hypothetical protein